MTRSSELRRGLESAHSQENFPYSFSSFRTEEWLLVRLTNEKRMKKTRSKAYSHRPTTRSSKLRRGLESEPVWSDPGCYSGRAGVWTSDLTGALPTEQTGRRKIGTKDRMCNEVTEKILIPGFSFSRSPFLVLVTSNTPSFYEGHEHYRRKIFLKNLKNLKTYSLSY